MDVHGKAAVVTGASRGVGKATAIGLARLGCHVMLTYRQPSEAAEQAVAEAGEYGVTVVGQPADVADDAACRAMAATAVEAFGRIDILVNNAGTTRFINHADMEAVSSDDWQQIMAVNLIGPFQCVRACLPHLRRAGSADVVNIASIAGLSMPGSSIPYGASKAALINMTSNLARALGRDNIRVNAVAPGFIEGRWLKEGLGDRYDHVRSAVQHNAALGRVSQPRDIAAAIIGLITGSDQVTGHTLVVDGGNSLGTPVL